MKWFTHKDSCINDFMALLSDNALSYFENSLDKFEIVGSVFSIAINSYVSIQCVVENNTAYILSFNYGKYENINEGKTPKEVQFIRLLENKYFESNSFIDLSPKNKMRFFNTK